MSRIDFVAPLYARRHSYESVVSELDSLLTSKDRRVCAIPFYSAEWPVRLLARVTGKWRQVHRLRKGKGCDLYEMTYQRQIRDQEIRRRENFFIAAHPKYDKVYVAMTLGSSDFIQHGLSPVLKSFYPLIVRPFVAHVRLRNMLNAFKTRKAFSELIITRASQILRLNEEGVHRRNMPMVSWPGMSIEEGFGWLDEHNGWFKSLQFEARDSLGRTKAAMSITRNGVIRVDRLFASACDAFIQPVCKNHYENIVLFSKRSRRDSHQLAAKPLMIDFGVPQFDTIEENAKFIQSMKRLRTASVSVLHGNPYISLSVVDYFDGSTFDVWVLSKEHMIIVPQMKGTVAAIKRLINHVFDTYAEGDLKNYAEAVT